MTAAIDGLDALEVGAFVDATRADEYLAALEHEERDLIAELSDAEGRLSTQTDLLTLDAEGAAVLARDLVDGLLREERAKIREMLDEVVEMAAERVVNARSEAAELLSDAQAAVGVVLLERAADRDIDLPQLHAAEPASTPVAEAPPMDEARFEDEAPPVANDLAVEDESEESLPVTLSEDPDAGAGFEEFWREKDEHSMSGEFVGIVLRVVVPMVLFLGLLLVGLLLI